MPSIKDFCQEVDAILIGAGAGLSAAAGIDYNGEDFRREFADFITRYGFTDLYTSAFYPFETEEERWAYWSRKVSYARIQPEALPLYRRLLELVCHKPHFVITTNVDGQFRKAGFDRERIFEVQGDYAFLQARSGTDNKCFNAEELFRRMCAEQKDCRIPSHLIPYYKKGQIALGDASGELMDIHVRMNAAFVEDEAWYRQAEHYAAFVDKFGDSRLLLLELGVGFNTPTIIRFPFERMASQFPATTLVRVNRDEPQCHISVPQHFYLFHDIKEI